MTTQPQESKGFKLLGHDRSAAWGGGSIVEVHKGYAYVGAVGGASYNGPEGFTAHDVRDPRNPNKVYEFRAPPGVHCHKVRVVGDHHLYVNSERLVGDKGKNARAGLFIFDISKPDEPREVGAGVRPDGTCTVRPDDVKVTSTNNIQGGRT